MDLSCTLVSLRSEIPWLEKPRLNQTCFSQSYHTTTSPQVKLLSGDGFSVTLPLPLLLASSALFRSVLSYQCCGTVDISIPSVGGGTLVLIGEILRRGETSSLEGAENSEESLKDVQAVLDMLQCGVNIAIKHKTDSQLLENKVESENMDEFSLHLENHLWDLNSNLVNVQSPSKSKPSRVASPSHSDSSSITLSPSDIKEEKKASEPKVLYIDVCLTDILSTPNLGDKGSDSKKLKKEVIELDKNVLSCPFCQRVFKAEKSLKQHISLLHPEPIHFCTKCDSSFFKKSSLEKHTRLTHLKIQCRSCLMSFTSKFKLTRHAEKAHKEYFQCTECDKKITSKINLVVHMNAAHTNFKCDECPVTLGSFDILQEHLELVHGDVRFACNSCNKIFKTKFSFMKHCEITSHDPKHMTKFKMPDTIHI